MMSQSVCVNPPPALPSAVLRAGAPLWRWPRLLSEPVATYAEELLTAPWFAVRVGAPVHALGATLATALDEAGVAATRGRELFNADVIELARLLASTARTSHVTVRVEHDLGARCPVFHEDNNVVRLLCTYTGPGTEWLPEEHLDRTQLGLRGRQPADANQAIARLHGVGEQP